jgi:glucose dehydrogenase
MSLSHLRLAVVVAGVALPVMVAVQSDGGGRAGREWPAVGGDATNARYSTLTQISTASVTRLGAAWRWT